MSAQAGGSSKSATDDASSPSASPSSSAGADPHQWLEEVTSPESLAWAKAQNAASLGELGAPEESPLFPRVLAILNSKEKIPYVHRRDAWLYNFWKDDDHVQGIWRRTTLESFCGKSGDVEWETMLDLDELSRNEGETWVWKGSTWYFEAVGVEQDICLVKLSRGGADAAVVREYDVRNRRFFEPGPEVFALEEAKSHVSYKTRDVLLVCTDFGEGSLTTSGYPRTVREWKRGTPLADAPVIFEGKPEDVIVSGSVQKCRGHTYEWHVRAVTFWKSEKYIREGLNEDGTTPMQKLEVPLDAKSSCFASFLLVKLCSPWEVDGTTYKTGSLLSFDFTQFMAGDRSSVQVLFEPDEEGRLALSSYTETYNYMILKVLNNVRTELITYRRHDGEGGKLPSWKRVHLDMIDATTGAPDEAAGSRVDAQISLWSEDEDTSDFIWMTKSGFTVPETLLRAEITDAGIAETSLKSLPEVYDASGLAVAQGEAKSLDGTIVPFFIVHPKDMKLDGTQPTLLYGYGGFEISMLPFYASKFGAGWLERGGVFALANIRGGGEFGPDWHQAALKEKRHKAYEDFEAVADHLVAQGYCSPKTLGCMGGSNGGLLTGNMLVRSPEKFGAIVCQVPLLDMKRYSHLLAGASWMGEFGDPDKPEEWAFVKRISPYHNITDNTNGDHPYPQILLTTSTRDDRVHPAHARKMVKRLQELGHSDTTFYYENIEGGHGGAANNTQNAFMSTLAYEFLWKFLAGGK